MTCEKRSVQGWGIGKGLWIWHKEGSGVRGEGSLHYNAYVAIVTGTKCRSHVVTGTYCI